MFASSACVPNEGSLFIRGCLAVPRDTCVVQPSTTSTLIASGSIDGYLNALGQYHCLALIENQMVERGDPTALRAESSRIQVYQAEVQVLDTDPVNPSAYAQFTVPISGFADPAQGNQPGIGVTDIVLIDHKTLSALADNAVKSNTVQQVVASVVLHGRTTGGLEVTSKEFKFPIEVCGGCKCAMPAGDVCVGSEQTPGADCLLGQDGLVDCRYLDPCSGLLCKRNSLNEPDLSTAACPGLVGGNAAYGPCCE